MTKEEEYQVRLILTGEMARRFRIIKKRYQLESNTDLVRMLITKEYDDIVRNRIPPEG